MDLSPSLVDDFIGDVIVILLLLFTPRFSRICKSILLCTDFGGFFIALNITITSKSLIGPLSEFNYVSHDGVTII
jgi:hypothetical protein